MLGRPFDGELIRPVQKFGSGRIHDGRPEKTIRKGKGCSLFGVGVALRNGTRVGYIQPGVVKTYSISWPIITYHWKSDPIGHQT